jgi:hypothetical protein
VELARNRQRWVGGGGFGLLGCYEPIRAAQLKVLLYSFCVCRRKTACVIRSASQDRGSRQRSHWSRRRRNFPTSKSKLRQVVTRTRAESQPGSADILLEYNLPAASFVVFSSELSRSRLCKHAARAVEKNKSEEYVLFRVDFMLISRQRGRIPVQNVKGERSNVRLQLLLFRD